MNVARRSPDAPAIGRPRKLTRDEIVAAAIKLVEKHGARGLTVRALGSALRTQASTLYNYYRDFNEIQDAVAAWLLNGVPLLGASNAPQIRERLILHYSALRRVLVQHPGVLDRRPGSLSWRWSLNRLEGQLAALRAAGIGRDEAFVLTQALDSYCTEHAELVRTWTSRTRQREYISGLKPEEYPNVTAVMASFENMAGEAAFQRTISMLIDHHGLNLPRSVRRGQRRL